MLDTLLHLKRVAPIDFDVVAVNLDQKQPGFPEHVLPDYFEKNGINVSAPRTTPEWFRPGSKAIAGRVHHRSSMLAVL